jgi:hypothetical protein
VPGTPRHPPAPRPDHEVRTSPHPRDDAGEAGSPGASRAGSAWPQPYRRGTRWRPRRSAPCHRTAGGRQCSARRDSHWSHDRQCAARPVESMFHSQTAASRNSPLSGRLSPCVLSPPVIAALALTSHGDVRTVVPLRTPHVAKGNDFLILPRRRLSNEDGEPRVAPTPPTVGRPTASF